ncbi:ABC transporter ATP-binding protein [Erysipelothrix sp. HDW6C]|uniref:ABC transporter ATP-binding protein n=1 Tax=Erysipelothrix sp. HDW6C TaxID=2714930 RepID=UPI00140C5441|nr:ABC transporter ATP-binding protein [Erysipelothrix sp. HDW6C]QIK69513.1 ABC transporter ATP-binding protein [Erysipelothrix sp. HDW6C]
MSVLKVRNVSVSFGDNPVLNDVSIAIEHGEIVSILGSSGVGKTTLFNVISGLLLPTNGSVYLDGTDITNQPGNISYMLQKDLLFAYRTVLDNATLPLLIRGWDEKKARQHVLGYLPQFGLEDTAQKYPHQLSGGMRQRVAFLRTFLMGKDVALLDEPFSALDTLTKSDMHAWYLKMMASLDLTTLFITHDIDEAIFLSDRILIMTGKPGEISHEIVVNVPRPRIQSFLISEDFMRIKKEIFAILKK